MEVGALYMETWTHENNWPRPYVLIFSSLKATNIGHLKKLGSWSDADSASDPDPSLLKVDEYFLEKYLCIKI